MPKQLTSPYLTLETYKPFIKKCIDHKYAILIFLAATLLYGFISIYKHLDYQSNAFDLAIWSQTSWLISHFQTPFSTVRMLFEPADHFGPTYWLLSIPYGLFNSPIYLLVIQILSVIIGAIPVWLIAKRTLNSEAAANFLLIAYFFQIGVIDALIFDFSTTALSIGFTAWAIYFWLNDRYRSYLILFVLSLGCKEDMPVLFAAFSLLMLYKKQWKWFIPTFGLSVIWYCTVQYIIMPALLHHSSDYIVMGHLFSGIAQKDQSLRQIFTQNLGLSLADPIGILFAGANLFTRFIKDGPNYWGNEFHYGANIAAPLIISAVFGIKRFVSKTGIHQQTGYVLLPAAMAASTLITMGVATGVVHNLPVSRRQIDAALNQIPAKASVSAQSALAPHLASRKDIYLYPNIAVHCSQKICPAVDYIVLSTAVNGWPLTDDQIAAAIKQLQSGKQYTEVANTASVHIFKKR